MSTRPIPAVDNRQDLPPRKLFIGLTGGIGSGKSTVAKLFQEYGIAVTDTDAISHQLTSAGGAAIPAIRLAFGELFLDNSGSLNRPKMRQLVFADPKAKQCLEAILHPLIRTQMLAQAQAASASPYLLLVVPLLFEVPNYRELVQRTLVVDCSEATQVARAMQRSGLSEQAIHAIMAQQITRTERLRLADDIVRNDGTLEELRQQVAQLHHSYLRLSSESSCLSSGSD